VPGNKVSFEHRSPQADDLIEAGMVNLMDGDKWIPPGTAKISWFFRFLVNLLVKSGISK
jgi:hypothetical protein